MKGNHGKITFGGELVRGLISSGDFICMNNHSPQKCIVAPQQYLKKMWPLDVKIFAAPSARTKKGPVLSHFSPFQSFKFTLPIFQDDSLKKRVDGFLCGQILIDNFLDKV